MFQIGIRSTDIKTCRKTVGQTDSQRQKHTETELDKERQSRIRQSETETELDKEGQRQN